MNRFCIRIIICCLLIAFLWLGSTALCQDAQQFQPDNSNRSYDWIMYVDIDNIPGYLNFPGSNIASIQRFKVTFQQTGAGFTLRGLPPPHFDPVVYEEFWYSGGQALGLNRQLELPIPANEQGAICFRCTEADANSEAIAECTMRLLLDAKLKQSLVAAVLIPQAKFQPVSAQIPAFNFHTANSSPRAKPDTSFRLISYPADEQELFYYES